MARDDFDDALCQVLGRVLLLVVSRPLDRHTPTRDIPAKYEEVRSAIFRVQNRSWKDITKERVARIMGKVKRNFEDPRIPESDSAPALELPMVADSSAETYLVLAENQIAEDTQDRVDTGKIEDDNQVAVAQVVAPEMM
ncbi:predicted protein [Arabidopsis lyrata subsp. lyrata]|uniref:Predicted protein n=1 Tax=Arabidopsis lyrata subsp. lyrata TaxID=81972 RepID=D7KSB5_ARALL|nr:predicted protein [Arabidopsis lyrata subsp. lyrata]